MMETLRIGDITGYDDADIIDMGDEVYLVIDTEDTDHEDEQQNI